MVRKLGGDDDAFISYRTAQYKLHFYETPANLRFVILTDTATLSMRNVLHQIYINLWVEYGVIYEQEECIIWANFSLQWSRTP
jgi:trafficking protein particle complex subunit 1